MDTLDLAAKARIIDLEEEVQDLHVIVDLQREAINDLNGQLRLAKAGLRDFRAAKKVEVA